MLIVILILLSSISTYSMLFSMNKNDTVSSPLRKKKRVQPLSSASKEAISSANELLWKALTFGNQDLLYTALKDGAQPNAVRSTGAHDQQEALRYAIFKECPRIVSLLLEFGAIVDEKHIYTALLLNCNPVAIARILLEKNDWTQKQLNSFLELSYKRWNLAYTHQALGLENSTQEMKLAQKLCEMLFCHGAQPQSPQEKEFYQDFLGTPEKLLMIAAREGKEKLLLKALEEGALIDTPCPITGNTALHKAAALGSSSLIKLLLSHNAQIDVLNGENRTPLAKAIVRNHGDVVKLLIEHGAQLSSQEGVDQEPLLLAISSRNEAMLTILLNVLPPTNQVVIQAFHEALGKKEIKLIKPFIKYGSSIQTLSREQKLEFERIFSNRIAQHTIQGEVAPVMLFALTHTALMLDYNRLLLLARWCADYLKRNQALKEQFIRNVELYKIHLNDCKYSQDCFLYQRVINLCNFVLGLQTELQEFANSMASQEQYKALAGIDLDSSSEFIYTLIEYALGQERIDVLELLLYTRVLPHWGIYSILAGKKKAFESQKSQLTETESHSRAGQLAVLGRLLLSHINGYYIRCLRQLFGSLPPVPEAKRALGLHGSSVFNSRKSHPIGTIVLHVLSISLSRQ